jgi:uridylate kinase
MRILIKASGQTLAGPSRFGFDPSAVQALADEIVAASHLAEVVVVVGGGNILRGSGSGAFGIDRVEADNVGTLGTAINALILPGAISSKSASDVRVMSALPLTSMAEPYIRLRALRHLEKGRIVVLACGIGQPFVTTDYPSVQRAIELEADLLLAAKNGVDGAYDSDPTTNPDAVRYETISYEDVIAKQLSVMDPATFILARDHGLPIRVFDSTSKGAMAAILRGESIGTLVRSGLDPVDWTVP